MAHLAVDRIPQLGASIANFPSDSDVKELNQVPFADDHKPDQQLMFEGDQQEETRRGGIGDGGIECDAPEQVYLGQGGVEPSIVRRSMVGQCDFELSVLVQNSVQSGNCARGGTAQKSGMERGAVECEVRALPLECLQALDDDGRHVIAVNASPQLSEPTRRLQPCQVLEDVYSLPHLCPPSRNLDLLAYSRRELNRSAWLLPQAR
jgi:hypothetical protein